MTPMKDIEFQLEFYKSFRNAAGKQVDMYWLTYAFDNDGVGLSVPSGRRDIAEFIARACIREKRMMDNRRSLGDG